VRPCLKKKKTKKKTDGRREKRKEGEGGREVFF
jgi:hypothetical protein